MCEELKKRVSLSLRMLAYKANNSVLLNPDFLFVDKETVTFQIIGYRELRFEQWLKHFRRHVHPRVSLKIQGDSRMLYMTVPKKNYAEVTPKKGVDPQLRIFIVVIAIASLLMVLVLPQYYSLNRFIFT